ncbi:MAG: ankyrin repeat domain-containing protein [candidate division Zixibacteria bacterium]|nr:ankyrin repeat domain-containing protein [candidate division Zixibacteria bacterium]
MIASNALTGEIDDAINGGDLARVKNLLNQDPSLLNVKFSSGLTPLNLASYRGKTDIVEALLDMGADMNIGDNENSKPMHNAAVGGHLPVIELLLARGADIDNRDDNGITPFLFACNYRQLETARYLIEKGADFKATNNRGWSALLYAVMGGNVELVKLLLEKKVDVNQKSLDEGTTPLFYAVWFGRDDIFRLLIAHGARINMKNNDGDSPLFWAMNDNCIEEAKLLVEKGVRVNERNNYGITVLHNVACRGTVSIAQFLLEQGADINATADHGETPLTLAASENADMVKFLIMNGAEVNPPKYKDQVTGCFMSPMMPVHGAIWSGKLDILKILVENGARINVLDRNGFSPLHHAIIQKNNDIVKYLLAHGAFLNVRDEKYGCTELHIAAVNGNRELVELLINEGSRFDIADNLGKTPADYAFEYGFDKIGYYLLAAGADKSKVKEYIDVPDYLARELQLKEAVVWHLGHSGWAVKTRNHFLIFDYWLRPDKPVPEQASLTGGYIVPAELKDFNVDVFVSHGHNDHYHNNIFFWKDTIAHINYIMGFNPTGIEDEYTLINPREEKTVNDIKVSTLRSTDAGVAFLLEVDGLTIFHAGDHANGNSDLSGAFPLEIDYLAAKGKTIDLAFFGITGCNLGSPESVKAGIYYAVDKLKPVVLLPMHGGDAFYSYKEFADEFEQKILSTRIVYPMARGDRFIYKDGRILEHFTDEVRANTDE